MKLHRFYTPSVQLDHDIWLTDELLLKQWTRVLRFLPGQSVVLFDGLKHERLYKIVEIRKDTAHLAYVTDLEPKKPKKNIYLMWSLLKKDKNDWVLQKGTELGASHFLPLLADRSEKTGFNIERARKIVIEAAEQCGRSDIPNVREPIKVSTAIKELKDKVELYVCEQTNEEGNLQLADDGKETAKGVLIGPEGGWSDAEKQLFKDTNLKHLNLHDFTLRAETAAVTAASKLLQ